MFLSSRTNNIRSLPNMLAGICALCLTLGATPALAAEITIDKQSNSKIVFIEINGDIEKGDASKFRRFALQYPTAVVILSSDGGYLPDALEIGQIIRINKYKTAAIKDNPCNSACGLIWLAGEKRVLTNGGRVGFHAAYVLENGGKAAESGVANAMVGRYLTLLNLSEEAVRFATTAPPTSLRYITEHNAADLGIIVEYVQLDEPTSNTSSSGGPVAPPPNIREAPVVRNSDDATPWGTVGPWKIASDHTLNNSCFLYAGFEDGTGLRIGVINNDKGQSYYLSLGNPKWTSLKVDDRHTLSVEFDDRGAWNFPATVIPLGSIKILAGTFSDTDFWKEFALSRVLVITRNQRQVAKLNLDKSYLAFEQLSKCQNTQNMAAQASDPFAQ